MKQQHPYRGFTLIELLLYMSLSLIMLAVLSGVGANVLESRTKAKAQEETQYAGQFVFETIATLLKQAEGIIEPLPQSNSSSLTLQMKNPEENPTVIWLENESIQIKKGGEPSVSLIGNTVAVSELKFDNVTQGEGRGALRMTLGVEGFNPGGRNAFFASTTLHTTINLHP